MRPQKSKHSKEAALAQKLFADWQKLKFCLDGLFIQETVKSWSQLNLGSETSNLKDKTLGLPQWLRIHLFLIFFSIITCHRTLNIVPCVIH